MIVNPFIWLSVLATQAGAAVVTLYGVSATEAAPPGARLVSIQVDGTMSYRAINPSQGSDITTYEVQDIRTQVVLFENDGTATSAYTVLSTPTTIKYTRVEGQSQLHQTISGAASIPTNLPGVQFAFPDSTQDCQLDVNKQQGICVQEFRVPILNIQTLTTAGTPTTKTDIETHTLGGTLTGTLVPIATVTTSGASALASKYSFSIAWGVLFLTSSILLSR